jgi:hypothetical protein
MILRIAYWSASVIALAAYALLMVIFAISKKDRNIKSIMLVMSCMIGWTGFSLLMKLNAAPGFAFWSLLLTTSMIVLPPSSISSWRICWVMGKGGSSGFCGLFPRLCWSF